MRDCFKKVNNNQFFRLARKKILEIHIDLIGFPPLFPKLLLHVFKVIQK